MGKKKGKKEIAGEESFRQGERKRGRPRKAVTGEDVDEEEETKEEKLQHHDDKGEEEEEEESAEESKKRRKKKKTKKREEEQEQKKVEASSSSAAAKKDEPRKRRRKSRRPHKSAWFDIKSSSHSIHLFFFCLFPWFFSISILMLVQIWVTCLF